MAKRTGRRVSDIVGIDNEWTALAWDLAVEMVAIQETGKAIERDAKRAKATKDMRFPVYDIAAMMEW